MQGSEEEWRAILRVRPQQPPGTDAKENLQRCVRMGAHGTHTFLDICSLHEATNPDLLPLLQVRMQRWQEDSKRWTRKTDLSKHERDKWQKAAEAGPGHLYYTTAGQEAARGRNSWV